MSASKIRLGLFACCAITLSSAAISAQSQTQKQPILSPASPLALRGAGEGAPAPVIEPFLSPPRAQKTTQKKHNKNIARKLQPDLSAALPNAFAGKEIDYDPVGVTPTDGGGDPATLAKNYCAAVAEPMKEAKAKWTAQKLKELEGELQKKIEEANARIEELRALEEQRLQAQKKADDNVVAIYAKMKPEAAAAQIATMDEATAVAILARLNVRVASAVLNEIPPEKAAKIANAMSHRNESAPKKTPL